MPISFCIVGLFSISILFFGSKKLPKNIFLLIGSILVLAGYFAGEVSFDKFSINFLILFGIFLCMIACMVQLTNKGALIPIVWAFVISAVYLVFCAYDYNFLLFFNPQYFSIAVVGLSLFLNGANSKISFILLSFILSELLSVLVVGNKMLFFPLFTTDIILCIAPIICAVLAFCIVQNLFKRRRKIEKTI